jgi:hypothetical protein
VRRRAGDEKGFSALGMGFPFVGFEMEASGPGPLRNKPISLHLNGVFFSDEE